MNLTCDVYTNDTFPTGPPRLTDIPCQLRGVAKMSAQFIFTPTFYSQAFLELILPAGTDIRGRFVSPANNPDFVVISGYGIDYPWVVFDTYPVARGFTNEYTVALVARGSTWTPPTP